MAADIGISAACFEEWLHADESAATFVDLFGTFASDSEAQLEEGTAAASTRELQECCADIPRLGQEQRWEPLMYVMDAALVESPLKRRRLSGKQKAPQADLENDALAAAERCAAEMTPKRRRLRWKQPPPPAWQCQPKAVVREARGRRPRPNELCPGHDGRRCIFSTVSLGAPSPIHPHRGQRGCLFCSDEHLDKLLACNHGYQVTKTLKDMKRLDEEQYQKCLCNLQRRKGDDFVRDFDGRVARAEKRVAPKLTTGGQWHNALEKRARARGELHRREKRAYDKTVLKDRMSVRRKIFLPELKGKHYTEANDEEETSALPLDLADIAPNDAGLPTAQVSDRARALEQWCKFGSWQLCDSCHSVRPRALQPVDLHKQANPTVKKCALCKRGDYVPKPEHVPEPLRGLQSEVIQALRPLDIDTGKYERVPYGYRVHSSMIQFLWSAGSVEDKIKVLPKKRQRKRARKAFRYLMADDHSMYSTFVEKHRSFLEKHHEPTDRQRRRPLRFIEELGLECALWPHLYYDTNLCETMTRLTDERRQAARRTGLSDSSEDEQHVEADEDDDAKVPSSRRADTACVGASSTRFSARWLVTAKSMNCCISCTTL